MGMDVYGKNATTEHGEYFRRNVWGWHPLWDYCTENFEVAEYVQSGHSNDGDGLDEENSLILARGIRQALADGSADEYIRNRNNRLASLPRLECKWCEGSGIRTDDVGKGLGFPERELSPEIASIVGRTHGFCNACSGEGKVDSWETNYFLDIDDIEQFATFLEGCGGFEIC